MADIATAYRYRRPSSMVDLGDELRATLSTSDRGLESPWFFEGSVAEPELVAAMLLAVARVARSRFTLSSSTIAAMRDPVATANAGVLRFESFSQCNGVYARFDLPLDEWSSAGAAATTTSPNPSRSRLVSGSGTGATSDAG